MRGGVRLFPYLEALRTAKENTLRLAGWFGPDDPLQTDVLAAYRELVAALVELNDGYEHVEEAANKLFRVKEWVEKEQQKEQQKKK